MAEAPNPKTQKLEDSLKAGQALEGYALHWVIRCSDLKPTLEFFEKVLGMKVIRHEENAEPCGITCNGRYNNAWSKTMVGYDLENKYFCLEITYNYGVLEYEAGTGLVEFAIGVEDPKKACEAAAGLGFKVEQELGYEGQTAVVLGPDNYRYRVMALSAGRTERFLEVSLRVKDLEASLDFYRDFLGMGPVKNVGVETPWVAGERSTVGYDLAFHPTKETGAAPGLTLRPVGKEEEAPRIEQWEGRFAVCLPAEELKRVYAKFKAERPELLLHDDGNGGPKALEEKLGTLYIFIAKDLDGYELCIVSRESLLPAVVEAGEDWAGKEIDWAQRRSFIDERAPKSKKGKSS